MRKQLAEYRNQYGDCNVPVGWPDNKSLGNWVQRQRLCKGKFDQDMLFSHLTKERIVALDSLGFVWNQLEESWEEMGKHLGEDRSQ